MILRRRRFAEVVARQLDLFERDEAELIRACDAAETAYDDAEREDAEERYAEYLEHVDTAVEALSDVCDAYASTLDEDSAARYGVEFRRAVHKRWPRFRLADD